MAKLQRIRSRKGNRKMRGVKRSRITQKRNMRGGYDSAWSYVSGLYGDLNTQVDNSLMLRPDQDVVSRNSTQSVPIGMPNANVKGVIQMNGGKRRRSSSRRNRSGKKRSGRSSKKRRR